MTQDVNDKENVSESIDEETLQKIKEKVRQNRIKEFRSRYETYQETTSPFVSLPGDGPEDPLAFGEAVMKGGKLIGFNMMRRLDRKQPPILDENGKQLFMTVEDIWDLRQSQFSDCETHKQIDDMVREELEHRQLNETTFGRLRMKAVKRIEKTFGVEVPKAPLGFKKKIEKPASELFDRMRQRKFRE